MSRKDKSQPRRQEINEREDSAVNQKDEANNPLKGLREERKDEGKEDTGRA